MSHCMAFLCPVLTQHGRGIWTNCTVNPCSARRILALRLVTGAASAFFPECPKINRSQKGMLRCFRAVVRWCPFGQLFGDYSNDGELLGAEDDHESIEHECDLEAYCTSCNLLLPWPLFEIRCLHGVNLSEVDAVIADLLAEL